MTQNEFENQFLELMKVLIGMENVHIPYLLLPNGDTVSIVVHSNYRKVTCFKGSLMIYKFNANRDDKDHLKILAEYIYKQHNDNECKAIIDYLKIETVRQV